MAKLKADPEEPGKYDFLCDCGHRRKIADSEQNFACERPVAPGTPSCRNRYKIAELLAPKKPLAPVVLFSAVNNPSDWTTNATVGSAAGAVEIPESKKETKKLTKPAPKKRGK